MDQITDRDGFIEQLEREWKDLPPRQEPPSVNEVALEFDLAVRAHLRSQALMLIAKGWEREMVAFTLAELAEELISGSR